MRSLTTPLFGRQNTTTSSMGYRSLQILERRRNVYAVNCNFVSNIVIRKTICVNCKFIILPGSVHKVLLSMEGKILLLLLDTVAYIF